MLRRDLVTERATEVDEPPDPDLATVAAPRDAAEIDGAGLHAARLHAVGRRLALAPGLQHDGDANGDALAIRPMIGGRAHRGGIRIRSASCADVGGAASTLNVM